MYFVAFSVCRIAVGQRVAARVRAARTARRIVEQPVAAVRQLRSIAAGRPGPCFASSIRIRRSSISSRNAGGICLTLGRRRAAVQRQQVLGPAERVAEGRVRLVQRGRQLGCSCSAGSLPVEVGVDRPAAGEVLPLQGGGVQAKAPRQAEALEVRRVGSSGFADAHIENELPQPQVLLALRVGDAEAALVQVVVEVDRHAARGTAGSACRRRPRCRGPRTSRRASR